MEPPRMIPLRRRPEDWYGPDDWDGFKDVDEAIAERIKDQQAWDKMFAALSGWKQFLFLMGFQVKVPFGADDSKIAKQKV